MKRKTLHFQLLFFFIFPVVVCFARQKMAILISMTAAQQQYLESKIIKPFEKQNKVRCEVMSTTSVDSIESILKKNEGKIYLVKVPFIYCWSLVRSDLLLPLNDFMSKSQLDVFNSTYILTWFGQKKEYQFFLPRKYETRIMVYSLNKVRDACANWGTYRDSLDAVLKSVNGYGLPRDYLLEDDPESWDYYDVFVAGYVWSQREYGGQKKPRIGHRAKLYSGTALRIIDRIYQCGGDSLAMLRMDGEAVVDAFEWEALYTYAGIYNPRMFSEAWSGQNLWEGFASDDIFLSFLTQLDCYYLYGTGNDGLNGYVKDTADIKVSLMPGGCSVPLNQDGVVLRKGTHAITTGGWWWAIPKKCPDPDKAYTLFTQITSKTNQLQECLRFGMIPVRKDILMDKSILFGKSWTAPMFQTSYRQIQINDMNILPGVPQFKKIVDVYLEAWDDIVVKKNWAQKQGPPDRAYIADRILKSYAVKVNKYLRQ